MTTGRSCAGVRITGSGPGPLLLERELLRRQVPVVAERHPGDGTGEIWLSAACLETLRIAGCGPLAPDGANKGGAAVAAETVMRALRPPQSPRDAPRPAFTVVFEPGADLAVETACVRLGAEPADRAILDAANLAWKLALVARGDAPQSLLESVVIERRTDAPSPLASRFSVEPKFRTGPAPEGRFLDFAVRLDRKGGARLVELIGPGALGLFFIGDYGGVPAGLADALTGMAETPPGLAAAVVSAGGGPIDGRFACIRDAERALHKAYGAMTGAFYLIRPDGIVAARWQHPSSDAVRAALRRMIGHTDSSARPRRSSGW